MEEKRNHFQSLASLQLIAIIAVVMGHLWISNGGMTNSLCVSFCFVYSGYFTAMFHRFDSSYGLKEHARFMWNKLAKLYPLYLLSFGIYYISNVIWHGSYTLTLKVMIAHLTLLSTWIPNADYYFGYNAVAWFICDLFFLYLMAPVVVRLLRRLSVMRQVIALVILLSLEFIGGYTADPDSDSLLLSYYHLYQFPPIRLLDYGAGIIIYNITQTKGWKRLSTQLTPSRSTCIEIMGILLFALFYWIDKHYLYKHCYRAFCILAPAVISLFVPFVLTSGKMGQLSKWLCINPLPALSKIGFEIYILQIVVYFLFKPLLDIMGIAQIPLLHFLVQNTILISVAWITHAYYVTPISRYMTGIWNRHIEGRIKQKQAKLTK